MACARRIANLNSSKGGARRPRSNSISPSAMSANVVLLGPFLVISVLPLAVALAGVRVNEWLVFVSIWNAFGSAFDLQFAGVILRKPDD